MKYYMIWFKALGLDFGLDVIDGAGAEIRFTKCTIFILFFKLSHM